MRLLAAVFVAAFAAGMILPAHAQQPPRPRPPGTVPLDEPPPPPPIVEPDPQLEPQVTIRTEGGQTIQEYRVNGKLVMVRVTPAHGRPYILLDHRADGQSARQDNLDPGVRVPQWIIAEF
jgi:hypothetical protein